MSQVYRVNDEIRISPVRLINSIGEMVGIVSVTEANRLAKDEGLDLVEISPKAAPPVCKILDYGKFLYDQKKKEKDQAKKNREHKVEIKELWLRPVTDTHDLQVKIRKAQEFLNDGNKVKFTVKFKGREMTKADLGQNLLSDVIQMLGDVTIEQNPTQNGKQMTLLVAPPVK